MQDIDFNWPRKLTLCYNTFLILQVSAVSADAVEKLNIEDVWTEQQSASADSAETQHGDTQTDTSPSVDLNTSKTTEWAAVTHTHTHMQCQLWSPVQTWSSQICSSVRRTVWTPCVSRMDSEGDSRNKDVTKLKSWHLNTWTLILDF